MAREHAVIFSENLPIPFDAFTFEGFQCWVEAGEFPDTGRVDFLAGEVETEMSPEDLYTHSVVKTAITSMLHVLIAEQDREISEKSGMSPLAGPVLAAAVVFLAIAWRGLHVEPLEVDGREAVATFGCRAEYLDE